MKITDIKATTVTVPLETPLRHSNGAHWGRFVRTIIEVTTDEGITGLGELGNYPYDRDPHRPGWYPLMPSASFADPSRPF